MVQRGERGGVSEVSILHLSAGLWALPMEADGGDKSPVHVCILQEENMDGLCQTLSVQCLPSQFLSCSHTARGAGFSTDPSTFPSGLLPSLVTFLPEGRTNTCMTAAVARDLGDTESLCDQCLGKDCLPSFASHSINPGAGQACNEWSFSSPFLRSLIRTFPLGTTPALPTGAPCTHRRWGTVGKK